MDVPINPLEWTEQEKLRLKSFARHLYFFLFLLMVAITAVGVYFGDVESMILTLPIIAIMAMAIFTDRKSVHIPPALIMILMASFLLSIVGRALSDYEILGLLSSFMTGFSFGILGLILVYMLLKSMPKVRGENPRMVSYFVLSSSLALFILMKMLQYFVHMAWEDTEEVLLDRMMVECVLVAVGALFVCFLYYVDERRGLFTYSLTSFLEVNSEALGIADREREDIERLIFAGESEKLEFKSTVRTNLETGEKDKRMEKAVLKTLVAFMNSEGGDLLIGVADDGSILGADVQSFDNKDKMGLHLTNLISSQIGNGFLPYLSINMVEFEEKVVIRVSCSPSYDPVFLKDGKVEIFYVRSGPQTVELTGMALIDYVDNRRKKTPKVKKALEKV